MKNKLLLAASVCVCLPLAAVADPSLECSIGNGSQVEIADCVAAAEANVDAALEIALSIARAAAQELDDVTGRASALPALEVSQSNWTAYRLSHCEAVGAMFGGGSGTSIGIRSCRIETGRARIEELMSFSR